MSAPAAVLLDVGGVLLLPQTEVVTAGLREAGVEWTAPVDPLVAHYRAVAALDASVEDAWVDQAPTAYVDGWLDCLGVTSDRSEAATAMDGVLGQSSLHLWSQVAPWAAVGLEALAATGVRLGVVSNADGTVEEQVWYVGDTVSFDVAGARAAGLHPVHLDPHGWCPVADDHAHVPDLQSLATTIGTTDD